jgi:hypothetical protein
VKIQI